MSPLDFKRVFAQPRRSADRYFTVLATSHDRGAARLGLAIAKKHVRRAVQRNRLKRIARESFRVSRQRFTGVDFVVMARSAAVRASNHELAASLNRHFERLSRCGPETER